LDGPIQNREIVGLQQPCLCDSTEVLREVQLQHVDFMDETSAATENAEGDNPEGRFGWLWMLMTPLLSCLGVSTSGNDSEGWLFTLWTKLGLRSENSLGKHQA
jgi:hypothetical protein